MQQVIFDQEESKFDVPTAAFVIGLGMIAPTITRVRHRRAEATVTSRSCCAARRSGASCSANPVPARTSRRSSTTAVRDGDEWVINGQKVWTSGAQYSDFGEIICRTNPDAEKHKGITAFIVDMKAPGVTIKPLKQMNGGAGVQRGVLRRRARARTRTSRRRERGLDGRDHDTDERARRDRLRRRRRRAHAASTT